MSVTNAYDPVVLEQASEQPGRSSDRQDRPSASPDRPTWGESLGETVALISAPAFFGPPVIFLLGPWLLLVLLLIPPAALLITLVAVMLVGAGLLVALCALIAAPCLLVYHLRARSIQSSTERPPFHRLPAPAASVPSTDRSAHG